MTILAGCAAQTKAVRPDWQNPEHRQVAAQLVPLLTIIGRDLKACKIFFMENDKLNAVSAGDCTFGFTTGLARTNDVRLIRGIAAHEVAHEILGHADKRKAAIAAEQFIRTGVSLIPGIGGLIASGAVLVAGTIALPAYSRVQEVEADEKAVEILRAVNDSNPAGTMAYTFRVLIEHAGAKGGGILDSHPGTQARLEAMLKLERQDSTAAVSLRSKEAEGPLSPAKSASIQMLPVTSPSKQEKPEQAPHGEQPASGPHIGQGFSPNREKVEVAAVLSSGIEDLAYGVKAHEFAERSQPTVVLIYRGGSIYSEKVMEALKFVAGRFAGRAKFFRSEVAHTDPAIIGPDAETMPLLIVFRNGKECARTVGLPTNRTPGGSPESSIADWLGPFLNETDDGR